jgi:hypothetical protein
MLFRNRGLGLLILISPRFPRVLVFLSFVLVLPTRIVVVFFKYVLTSLSSFGLFFFPTRYRTVLLRSLLPIISFDT